MPRRMLRTCTHSILDHFNCDSSAMQAKYLAAAAVFSFQTHYKASIGIPIKEQQHSATQHGTVADSLHLLRHQGYYLKVCQADVKVSFRLSSMPLYRHLLGCTVLASLNATQHAGTLREVLWNGVAL